MKFDDFRKKNCLIISLIFLSAVFSAVWAGGIERYAIYIGSNKGGNGRTELLYAGSDAENIKNAMKEIGGISDANSVLLVNPSEKDVENAISFITKKIENNKINASRTEFLFYYSGHSDEEALLLGEQKYDYSLLKNAISEIPSDIHVVILDSCYSGNFIRTKGGQKKKPFLMDDSSVVKGHAYLSSSSETEYSQESDEIEASYFTNAVVTGLRGAADSSGDKKVTLNELYTYAFNETLKKTEDSKNGPQHPNYNITLVGSGDLILSDFSDSDSIVSIGKDVTGKIVLRDSKGKLVSEIDKNETTPIMLALPAGKYSVLLLKENDTLQGEIEIKKDEAFVIDGTSFTKVDAKENRTRGNNNNAENDEISDNESNLSKNELFNFKWNFKYNKSEEKEDKSSEGNFNLSIGYVSTPIPFDIILGIDKMIDFIGGNQYDDSLFKDDKGIVSDVTALNCNLRFSTFKFAKEKNTVCVGLNSSFMVKPDVCAGYTISPSIGVYHTGKDYFKGLYLFVNPVIFTFLSNDLKSFWNWQSNLEFGGSIPVSNLVISPFVRLLFGVKAEPDSLYLNEKLSLGISLATYFPSTKNSMFYRKK